MVTLVRFRIADSVDFNEDHLVDYVFMVYLSRKNLNEFTEARNFSARPARYCPIVVRDWSKLIAFG